MGNIYYLGVVYMKKIIGNHKIITIAVSLIVIILVAFTVYFCTSKQDRVDDLILITPNGGEKLIKGSSVEIRWYSSNMKTSDINKDNISLGLDANSFAYHTRNYGLQLDSANYILSDFSNRTFRVDPLYDLPYKIDGGINSTVNSSFGNDLGISFVISDVGYVFKPSSKFSVVKAQSDCESGSSGGCQPSVPSGGCEIEINPWPIIGAFVLIVAIVGVGIGLIIWAATIKLRKEFINIDLFKGGMPILRIAEKFPNIGLFNWTVSIDLPDGDDYFIRISNSRRGEISDDSDSTFSIIRKVNTNNTNDDENDINNNNDIDNEPDNDGTLISEAQAKILPFVKTNQIETISTNQLPEGMPHSFYVNFDSISNEVGNMPYKKADILNRFINNTFKQHKPKNLSPLEEYIADYLAEKTMKENLEMLGDVKEMVMGVGLLKYGSKPAMLGLARVVNTEKIRNRMENSKEYYSRHIIEGFEVYKSVSTSTIILSNQVIGITNRGLERLIIKSYSNKAFSDMPEVNRDVDLFWAKFDVKGLGYVVDDLKLDKLGIDKNELDKVSFKVSKYDDRYSLSANIETKNPLLAHKYTSIFNKLIAEAKEIYTKTAFIGLPNDVKSTMKDLLDSLVFTNDGNSISIDADIYNTIIDKVVNQ